MKQALTSAAFLIATGVVTFGVSQGCSSDKANNGFGETSDAGNADVYVPPAVGTDQPDSGDIVGEGCGGGEVLPTPVPVYFEFVADGSGSMASDNKWPGQVNALKAVFEDIKNRTTTQIGNGELADTAAGVIVFADTLDASPAKEGPYPTSADLDVQPIADNGTLGNFWGRVGGQPDDLTPTLAALTGAYGVLERYVPQANVKPNGKRVVVLLSDGQPTDDYPANSIKNLAAAKAAQPKSIYTYSIGIGNGSSYSPTFMANLAVAGKTAPTGCNPALTTNPDCFYQIDPSGGKPASQITSEMVAALTKIRAIASECDLTLVLVDKDGKPADPKKVQVTYVDKDGKETPIAKDPTNGWTYDNDADPTRIILNGNACVQARSDVKGKTKVKLGCKTGGG
ncbi:MAG: VWA domain-containing protein [Polyangiaceae bacterium]|nr:VWA domain-containing protein [Polyangiaceae bacterium]